MEVEAYIGTSDLASHARFGRTARNAVMFGVPGIAYVYLVYGMYDCLNVVTEPAGRPAAVLIRAVEPMAGVDAIRAARVADALARPARRPDQGSPAVGDSISAVARRLAMLPAARLTSGPGLVASGFGITRADTGLDLLDAASGLRLEVGEPGDRRPRITTSQRVGIDYAPEPWRSLPWRFLDVDSPSLSRRRGARLAG